MFVYAKDKDRDDSVMCISLEECKASPWRWEFVQYAPGQGDLIQEPFDIDTYDGPLEVKPTKGVKRASK